MSTEPIQPRKPLPDLLNRDIVRSVCGDIADAKVVAIIATGASFEELEEAVATLAGETEVLSAAGVAVSAPVADVCEILTADEDIWDVDKTAGQ